MEFSHYNIQIWSEGEWFILPKKFKSSDSALLVYNKLKKAGVIDAQIMMTYK